MTGVQTCALPICTVADVVKLDRNNRVLVGQVEFRTHLGLDIGPEWAGTEWSDDQGERYEPFHVSGPDLVAGRLLTEAWDPR